MFERGLLHTFYGMDKTNDKPVPPTNPERRYSAASERNRAPILAVLKRVLSGTGLMLEIGAGSGQHAAYFAPHFPEMQWQPTEPDPEGRASIEAWAAETGAPNMLQSMDLDVTQTSWPVDRADAMFSANMIHIAPWPCCLGLMAGAGRVLSDGGVLCLYGPFMVGGKHTAPSNAEFDQSLKSQDPAWGIRDLDEVTATAEKEGLRRTEIVDMPANNMMLVFHRRP
mgnify:CR=1 FL=1